MASISPFCFFQASHGFVASHASLISLVALVLLTRESLGARVKLREELAQQEGDGIGLVDAAGGAVCQIDWEVRGENASISFTVPNCAVQCKASNFDNNHNVQFGRLFSVKQEGQNCHCTHDNGRVLVSYTHLKGDCATDKKAHEVCFQAYKEARTIEVLHVGNTFQIVRHPKEHDDNTAFLYTCPGTAGLLSLPSPNAGRSEKEQEIMVTVFLKDMGGQKLSRDEQKIFNQISDDDKDDIMYNWLAWQGTVTVGDLKDYCGTLAGTDVGHYLSQAGLGDEDQTVDVATFKKFAKKVRSASPEELEPPPPVELPPPEVTTTTTPATVPTTASATTTTTSLPSTTTTLMTMAAVEEPPLPAPPRLRPSKLSDIFDMEKLAGRSGVVFVVDTSASMDVKVLQPGIRNRNHLKSRWQLVRKELNRICEDFGEDINFNIIAFSDKVQAFAGTLQKATAETREQVKIWLRGIEPGGFTGMEDGLRQAHRMTGVGAIYLLSDGMANRGCTWARCMPGYGKGIPIHSTFFAPGDKSIGAKEAQVLLRQLSKSTGGDLRIPDMTAS